jgi:hypothetical protein
LIALFMPMQSRIRLYLLALSLGLSSVVPATAADYASEISAYRRAHRLPAVTLDSRLSAVALKQAQAMAATGTVSHSAGGNFAARVAPLRKSRAAEKYRRGFYQFFGNAEAVGRQCRPSRESPDGGCTPRRRRFRRQSEVALPEILGDGDYGLTRG